MKKLHTTAIDGITVLSLQQVQRNIDDISNNISRRVGMSDKVGKEYDMFDWLSPQERAVRTYNYGFHMGMRKALQLLTAQINDADNAPVYRPSAFVKRVDDTFAMD